MLQMQPMASFLLVVQLALGALPLSKLATAAATPHPHILLIVSDDVRYKQLSSSSWQLYSLSEGGLTTTYLLVSQ